MKTSPSHEGIYVILIILALVLTALALTFVPVELILAFYLIAFISGFMIAEILP